MSETTTDGSAREMPARSVTERGFDVYDEFTDTYGSQVRVQRSSSAAGARCWVFANSTDPSYPNPSPHLDVEQARRLRDALSVFIAENEGPA